MRDTALMARGLASVGLLVALQAVTLPEGMWGGPHARLTIQKNSGALEFDCARGSIDERPRLDRSGHFDVPGRYVPEHGGPVRRSEATSGQPVRYRGQLKDQVLTFDIVARNGEVIDTYSVEQGKTVRLVKCR